KKLTVEIHVVSGAGDNYQTNNIKKAYSKSTIMYNKSVYKNAFLILIKQIKLLKTRIFIFF
ncbi:hypothetical protein, partial [Borreliella garinii]|uniref:hypothetical protein n=1 Tax=Borreliella garinii TaxID=29519 RepID=UPI001AEEDA26